MVCEAFIACDENRHFVIPYWIQKVGTEDGARSFRVQRGAVMRLRYERQEVLKGQFTIAIHHVAKHSPSENLVSGGECVIIF